MMQSPSHQEIECASLDKAFVVSFILFELVSHAQAMPRCRCPRVRFDCGVTRVIEPHDHFHAAGGLGAMIRVQVCRSADAPVLIVRSVHVLIEAPNPTPRCPFGWRGLSQCTSLRV